MTDTETAALARIRQMADYWEQHLPEVIRTPAVVSALRAAMEPAAGEPPTDRADAPAAECSAQHRRFDDGRLCIRAAQHRGDHIDERGFHWSDTVAVYPVSDGTFRRGTGVRAGLRRMANETPAAQPDTLPAWLHWRFGPHGQPWSDVPEEDKALWEHQARAVRRAVARGGFKQPAAGAPQGGARPSV